MTAQRTPLFCSTALAARIERAEAQLITRGSEAAHRRKGGDAGFVTRLAGGVACFAEPGSPLNKVAGLGFEGPPSEAALHEVERAFAARGAPVQVELAHLADPAIGELLTARGYRLVSFENVLGFSIAAASARAAADIEVRESGEAEFDKWLDVVVEGFGHPDAQGVPSHESFAREALENAVRDLAAAAGVMRYLAWCDGVVAGGASFRIAEGVAQFTGAATLPAHRRKGVQTALLTARLARAAGAGCDVAVVTTMPGSKSQENAQRQGFELLYTRAVLVKQV